MLGIIAGHFGVGGVFHAFDPSRNILHADTFTWQIGFTQLVDWGGDFGNAIFILITGYFMVSRTVHWKKLALLLLTMLFYSWLIAVIVFGGHFQPVTVKSLLHAIFPIFFGASWFVSCYIIFSLFIPFINMFLTRLTKMQYQVFLLLFFIMFSVLPTFKFDTFFSEARISFFFMVYACGAYLKLFGAELILPGRHKKYLHIFIAMLAVLLISIVVADVLGLLFHQDIFLKAALYTAFKAKAWLIPMAICLFMYFLSRPYFFNAPINKLAGTVLGIYLIHTNDLLSDIIWDRILPNLDYIDSSWWILFYAGKVSAIFAICSLIELLRKHYIEPVMISGLDCCWPSLQHAVNYIQMKWKQRTE